MKPFNQTHVIASPTKEGQATRPTTTKVQPGHQLYAFPINFLQPFQGCTQGGLPAMGYDFVSPMVIHIEGFRPSFVANLRFAITH